MKTYLPDLLNYKQRIHIYAPGIHSAWYVYGRISQFPYAYILAIRLSLPSMCCDPMNLISGVKGIKAMKAEGVISISNIQIFDYLYFVDSLINCACWELN